MRVRWIGVMLVLAALGVAAGYGLGTLHREDPRTFAAAEPVPAVDPSIPVIPPQVLPDPTFPPALPIGLPLVPRTVGDPPFELTVPVPKGWVRTNPTSGEWRWYPQPGPKETLNTYFLRVRLIGNSYRTVTASRDGRIEDLENAVDVDDFHLEEKTTGGFVANYVAAEHRRVAMEEFLAPPGGTFADAWIALIGREPDRAGIVDLFPRIVAGVHR
jgi:hypothetical protein